MMTWSGLFEGAIIIQLLNQLEDAYHNTRTVDYATVTDKRQNSRVICGEKAVLGPRIEKFVPHCELGFDAARNCQYLQGNQVKFRVLKATNIDPSVRIHKRCLALECFTRAVEPKVCILPIQFTLSDFERQKKQNVVWYSPAFYTHPQGYRMCLQVWPNGCCGGLGTHVSIFTCLMRSPYDDDLK